ncbi:MAG: glycosyltransferase family 4 protein [Actinobacteria bacterium]|nr:glycosyltransferase family 4 protein [Actinomycetota bacterium]
MRIGIDISTVLNHGSDIGAGRYIFNLLKNLFAIDYEDTFVLTGRYISDDYLPLVEELKNIYAASAEQEQDRKTKLEFKLFKTTQKKLDAWNRLRLPAIETLGFAADILHCPDFMICPTFNKKIILTINDLAFIRFTHFNFDWFIKKYTKEVKRNSEAAKRIIAISQSTKNDIVKFFNTDPEKIDVTHLAADASFRKLSPDQYDRSILEKYKIKGSYILSVGTIEPRKNYVTLIRAFNLLKSGSDRGPSHFKGTVPKLVIVGRTGWKSEAAYTEYENSIYKKDIIFVGRSTDDELVHLYNMAELFVYPSKFEGFGLPVVEAMQCGLAVCASSSSSIPELMDYKNTLFNPADEEDIAAKIMMVLGNENLRSELGAKSLENAKRFSWRKTAAQTLDIYRKVYDLKVKR